uniref:SCP domain-containing protein n=1 Tax=Meloidogyne hapla TaxID=6305 RepID=A0A1I8C0J8_MELHA
MSLVKFSILTIIFFLGIFYSFAMMGERSRDCDELLMESGTKGIEKFHNICTNPNTIKSDIQTQLVAWAAEFNVSTILSDNSKTRVHECNATFALLEGNSTRPEGNQTMRHEHMSCMHPPPSLSVCTLYPKECYHGRVPVMMMNN